jgi:hypothetical protein
MPHAMWTDRSAVVVVVAENDFVPSSPWNFPKAFTAGRIVTVNIPLEDARGMVRGMNKANLENRTKCPASWNHEWALCIACPRDKGLDKMIRVVSAKLQRKAGAV